MLRVQQLQGRLGDPVAAEADLARAEPLWVYGGVGVWQGSEQEPGRLWLQRAVLVVVHGGGGWPQLGDMGGVCVGLHLSLPAVY
jgi:hypothetical protein